MRDLLKKRLSPFLQWVFYWYYKKPRSFRYEDIKVRIEPGVFPPNYTFSTKVFLRFISTLDLKEKKILELGCGSGIIALFSAKKGGSVTASDINKTAIEALKKASLINGLPLKVLYSDLFDNLSSNFDYIFINPPYYPKDPKEIKENAWFCGANFEYFLKLFPQLKTRLSSSKTFMILSEDCDIDKIKSIASESKIGLDLVHKEKVVKERNYIFELLLLK